MIAMTVVVKVKPEKQEEFLQVMRSLNTDQEIQEGLRKSILHQEIDDQTGFSLIYEWETQKDLDRYLGAEKFMVLLGALKVLGEKSEIRYRHISEE
ncbi:MAG: antibiotic biosynthesis monooxygenase family protein [Thermodesulfobacteriota bacterium]